MYKADCARDKKISTCRTICLTMFTPPDILTTQAKKGAGTRQEERGRTMADTKMTKRDLFTNCIAVFNKMSDDGIINADKVKPLVDGLTHEITLLERKRNSSKGADAKRKAEQEVVKSNIRAVLADATEPKRASDIVTDLGDGTTVQRVSALVKQMVDAGEVTRKQDKKVVTFTLA